MNKKTLSVNATKAEFVKSIHNWLMNTLEKNNKADYIITGQWAKKAWKEAARYGD